MSARTLEETITSLRQASEGFDHLFANDMEKALETFKADDSPFHLLGVGICSFLEAALGMEADLVSNAATALTVSENTIKAQLKIAKSAKSNTRFPVGTEFELLNSDAVILHGITHALRLYKVVYPNGLDDYATPSASTPSSRPASIASSAPSSASTTTAKPRSGFFSRFGSSLTVPSSPVETVGKLIPDGPLEELIMSGTAFGYGMFNLVFSLLPAGIRGVVGFLGFKHDRKLALRALAVSAAQKDVHAVFAGLTLMTYYGVVLLLSGYQADEQHILKQYRAIVDNVDERYPTGSLWILNRAKILRMSGDTPGAIDVLQAGLKPDRPHTFAQADGLLIFELAWTLLSQRRLQEAADTFLRMTEVNSWSHATYYFMAAGCHISLKDYKQAQKLFDAIPNLLDKKKIGGKDLPTEVFIKKKLQFYQEKQTRLTGSTDNWAQCVWISPGEELSIFWNTHSRISKVVAQEHITELAAFSPLISIPSPLISKSEQEKESAADLVTPEELAVRALLLGILHRTAGEWNTSRSFLLEAKKAQHGINTWIPGVATFELAVLELKETEAQVGSELLVLDESKRSAWKKVLKGVDTKLNEVLSLAPQTVDLSSRLDMRVAMLRDEIGLKKDAIDGEQFIPPVQDPYAYIIFRAAEVKDLAVDEPVPRHRVHDDPAVLGVSAPIPQGNFGYPPGQSPQVPPAAQAQIQQQPAQQAPQGQNGASPAQGQSANKNGAARPPNAVIGGVHSATTSMETVERALGDLRVTEVNGVPQVPQRGGRRGGGGRGQQQGHEIRVPNTDFDFQGSNARFDKAALSPRGTPTVEGSPVEGEEAAQAKKEDDTAYNPKKSFFDSLSSGSNAPTADNRGGGRGGRRGGGGRNRREEERERNVATFGEPGGVGLMGPGAYVGGWGGYGRRGNGRGRRGQGPAIGTRS
ncbi:hypothetical protein EUX98_g3069 [Antrodiella citrinella]|uniref:Inclusion body clearance protein IML2 n=1 Tax=Antrodiella citrinella TaxID=2447956 RepID=A0A4S4MXF5_9APHY|nr:hypothetical protein EUX98_g3069 [Antrodiella citrinella]